jgi:hypothetical protein
MPALEIALACAAELAFGSKLAFAALAALVLKFALVVEHAAAGLSTAEPEAVSLSVWIASEIGVAEAFAELDAEVVEISAEPEARPMVESSALAPGPQPDSQTEKQAGPPVGMLLES